MLSAYVPGTACIECSIAALNAGKHVLCEKPMATTVEDAIAMKEAAERNNKLLMIGFVRRFGDDCDLLKDFADKDFFGDIYYAKASYLRRFGNPGGWFGDSARSGGGSLFDLGVHVIDLGQGSVDFKAYLNALEDIGYTGYLTIEREVGENPEKDIQTAKEFLEKIMTA